MQVQFQEASWKIEEKSCFLYPKQANCIDVFCIKNKICFFYTNQRSNYVYSVSETGTKDLFLYSNKMLDLFFVF